VETAAHAAGRQLGLGDAGFGEDALGVQRDEGVQVGLEPLAAREERPAQLDGRQRAPGQAGRQLGDPEVSQLVRGPP